MSYFNELIVK